MFLAAGLLPTLWLLRRMPIGFFFMAGGWAAILAGIAIVPSTTALWMRRTRARRRLVVVLGAVLVGGLGLLAMIPAARADARGTAPVIGDSALRAGALTVQIAIAAWVLARHRLHGERRSLARNAVTYGAAIFTVTLGVLLGRRLPMWVIVPIVGVVAARFALLPVSDHWGDERSPAMTEVLRTVLFFTWTVAVLALQTQLLRSVGGLVAVTCAFVVGLLILLRTITRDPGVRAQVVGTGAAAFVAVMFAFVLLMPSIAGGRYLLEIGVRPIPHMVVAGARSDDGIFTRWYSTDLGRQAAVAAVVRSFRSPPVSAWSGADPSSTVGLLFGYRLEARYYGRGERVGGSAPCSTELHACVALAVRRSSN